MADSRSVDLGRILPFEAILPTLPEIGKDEPREDGDSFSGHPHFCRPSEHSIGWGSRFL